MAINMAKQATEDEKAILQHACTRSTKVHVSLAARAHFFYYFFCRYIASIEASQGQINSLQQQVKTLTTNTEALGQEIAAKNDIVGDFDLASCFSSHVCARDRFSKSKSSFKHKAQRLRRCRCNVGICNRTKASSSRKFLSSNSRHKARYVRFRAGNTVQVHPCS